MTRNVLTVSALLLAVATPAVALDFAGGTFGLDYTTYPDIEEITATGFSSDIEFAITPQFSAALSMSTTTYDIDGPFELSSSSTFAHGIYHINDAVKVGAFWGNESVFYYSSDTYGLEAAYDNGSFNAGGYVGAGQFVEEDVTLYGLNGGYLFGAGFGINADVDIVDMDINDYTMTTSSVGVEYSFGNGAAISLDVGQFKVENEFFTDEEDFVTLGASYSFGPNGGVSFEAPNALNSLLFFGPT